MGLPFVRGGFSAFKHGRGAHFDVLVVAIEAQLFAVIFYTGLIVILLFEQNLLANVTYLLVFFFTLLLLFDELLDNCPYLLPFRQYSCLSIVVIYYLFIILIIFLLQIPPIDLFNNLLMLLSDNLIKNQLFL